jgi:hypothetical protein
MPPAGFEPAIPASEWPQTHDLERVATGIGFFLLFLLVIHKLVLLSLLVRLKINILAPELFF